MPNEYWNHQSNSQTPEGLFSMLRFSKCGLTIQENAIPELLKKKKRIAVVLNLLGMKGLINKQIFYFWANNLTTGPWQQYSLIYVQKRSDINKKKNVNYLWCCSFNQTFELKIVFSFLSFFFIQSIADLQTLQLWLFYTLMRNFFLRGWSKKQTAIIPM